MEKSIFKSLEFSLELGVGSAVIGDSIEGVGVFFFKLV